MNKPRGVCQQWYEQTPQYRASSSVLGKQSQRSAETETERSSQWKAQGQLDQVDSAEVGTGPVREGLEREVIDSGEGSRSRVKKTQGRVQMRHQRRTTFAEMRRELLGQHLIRSLRVSQDGQPSLKKAGKLAVLGLENFVWKQKLMNKSRYFGSSHW